MPTFNYGFNPTRRAIRDEFSALTTHRRKCVSLLRSAMLCVRQNVDDMVSAIRACDMPVPERMAVPAARMIDSDFDSQVFAGGEAFANDPATYEQAIVVIAAFVNRHSFSYFADTTALGRRWHVLQHLALRAQRTNSPLPIVLDPYSSYSMTLVGFDNRPNYRDSEDFAGWEGGIQNRDQCWWTLTCSTRVLFNYGDYSVGLGADGEVTISWSDGNSGSGFLVGTFNLFDPDFPGRSLPEGLPQFEQEFEFLRQNVRTILYSMLSSTEACDRMVFRSLRRFADRHNGRSWFGTWLRTPAARRSGISATAFRCVSRLSSYTRSMRLTEAAAFCPPLPRGWLRGDIAAAGSVHPRHPSHPALATATPAVRRRQARAWDWNNIPDEVRRIMEADLALHLEEPTTEGA